MEIVQTKKKLGKDQTKQEIWYRLFVHMWHGILRLKIFIKKNDTIEGVFEERVQNIRVLRKHVIRTFMLNFGLFKLFYPLF